jgi:hypothetical protein
MANEDRNKQLPTTVSQPGSLLQAAFAHLSDEQKQVLALKVHERKLDLDVKAEEADMRYRASSVDMVNTINQVNALEQSTKSDYTVRAEYETASGRTNVEIKKSNNTVIIVIAIVVAIIVLMLFSK